MSKKIFFLSVFFCAITLAAVTPVVSAFTSRNVSTEYIKNGNSLLDNNQVVSALEQFMKAFVVDPGNNLAIAQIKRQLEISAGRFSLSQQFELNRFLELADYIQFLYDRLDYFAESNQNLYEYIAQNCPENDSVKESIRWIADKLNPGEHHLDPVMGLSSLFDRDRGDFNFYNDILLDKKRILLGVLSERLMVNRELRRIKNELKNRQPLTKQKTFHALPSRKATTEPDWKKELDSMRAQLLAMHEQMQLNDKRVTELTKEIAGMSLELYEKNKVLGERESSLMQMQNLFNDAQARMALVQRIIQEKDEQIRRLEEQVAKVASPGKNEELSPSSKNQESLRVLVQGEVKEQIDSYQKQINSLEAQFSDLRQRYIEITAQLEVRDKKITQLQDVMINNEIALKRYELIVASKDEKLLELDGIIKIYKGRLEDTSDVLQDTVTRLQAMEKQLGTHLPETPENESLFIDKQRDLFSMRTTPARTRLPSFNTLDHLPSLTNIDFDVKMNPLYKAD